MKYFCCSLLIVFAFSHYSARAQTSTDATSLIKEAVQLNKEGKYNDAVGKYSEALKLDSDNVYANYGIAFSLLASGKGDDGISYLEKVVKTSSPVTAWAYALKTRKYLLNL